MHTRTLGDSASSSGEFSECQRDLRVSPDILSVVMAMLCKTAGGGGGAVQEDDLVRTVGLCLYSTALNYIRKGNTLINHQLT